jgi:hypothetical protein
MAGGSRHDRDGALVTALAAGAGTAAVARHAGVNERTVRRRLQDPAFKAKVDEARAELVRQAVGRLAAVGQLAADKLHALLSARSETVQLQASRSILEFMFRGAEADTLARQLIELRERVEGLTNGLRIDAAGGGTAHGGPEGPAEGPRWFGGADADAGADPG